MQAFTKEEFISKLKAIKKQGWILSHRQGNDGGVGNTLEDLLGIKENNIPLADWGVWELKTQRKNTSSLTTLFHVDPEPRKEGIISEILLPKYGWQHKEAGKKYPINEKSFRATLNGNACIDRGFKIVVDREAQKVLISFDSEKSAPRHSAWLADVKKKVGLGEINPQPYWSFETLKKKLEEKVCNMFYVVVDNRGPKGNEEFLYSEAWELSNPSFEKLLHGLETGSILIDFDARTGHNHGTKFRMHQNTWIKLYDNIEKVL